MPYLNCGDSSLTRANKRTTEVGVMEALCSPHLYRHQHGLGSKRITGQRRNAAGLAHAERGKTGSAPIGRPQRSDPAPQPAPGAPEGGAPGGGPPVPAPNQSSNRRLQQTQAQVKEVVDIMCVNVDKVLERDQKLSELDDRADALQAGASQFESSAAKLKRKYWWKNCKMMIMMGVICAIVVVVIVSKYQKAQDQR
ncbi:vesicle-associated membrane protein 1 [Cariama cristata]